ncbi:unnamed protein product [Rangifer tarandus platyrhynchus]|uniref:Uncharacterized protein n=1 Tax=Rangifer tarandus platyrhynchus TaxID=3082113 RepID=A0AC59Z3G5_RANTA
MCLILLQPARTWSSRAVADETQSLLRYSSCDSSFHRHPGLSWHQGLLRAIDDEEPQGDLGQESDFKITSTSPGYAALSQLQENKRNF